MKMGSLLGEQVWGKNQEFCLEHGRFEMPTFDVQVERDVKKAGGYLSIDFIREVWSGNTHFGIFPRLGGH